MSISKSSGQQEKPFITYWVNQSCGSLMEKRIDWAFNSIMNETNNVLTFEKSDYRGSRIEVSCFENNKLNSAKEKLLTGEFFIAEGKGYISLYDVKPNITWGCKNYPETEIHEILHLFGFEHINNTSSIMNPWENCKIRGIDKEIIINLTERYS